MTTSQAINQARGESSMYRQGCGWILSTWSEHHRASWLSQEMDYWRARQGLKEWRVDRALQLLGWSPEDANCVSMECEGRTEDIVRAEAGTVR